MRIRLEKTVRINCQNQKIAVEVEENEQPQGPTFQDQPSEPSLRQELTNYAFETLARLEEHVATNCQKK